MTVNKNGRERIGAASPPAQGGRERSFLFTRDRDLGTEAGEDYAIRKVPYHWKRGPFSYSMLVFGTTTSMFGLALGGQLYIAFGMPSTLLACVVGFGIGAPIASYIARQCCNSSIDVDLLSRGAGFGFLGSTVTALIYGSNFLMYAGIEVVYMGDALHSMLPGVPQIAWYAVLSVIFIPLNWFGVAQNDFLQKWSLPLFVAGLMWLLIEAVGHHSDLSAPTKVTVATFVPALAAVLADVAMQSLIVGDTARFVRKSQRGSAVTIAVLFGIGGLTFLMAPIGAFVTMKVGDSNPGSYTVGLLGVGGLVWLLVTQVRIQQGNFYSGSLSLANFSARILHFRPGRRAFLFFISAVAFLLAVLGITDDLTRVITFMGAFLWAWVSLIVYFFAVDRRRSLADGTLWVEHRRGYLKNWGVPYTVGVAVGSIVGAIFAYTGYPEPYGGIVSQAVAIILSPLTAYVVGKLGSSRDLLARLPDRDWRDTNQTSDEDLQAAHLQTRCGSCGSHIMKPDALSCPLTITPSGTICSSCCMANAKCGEICKSYTHSESGGWTDGA